MKDQKKTTKQQNRKFSRRDFMGGAAATAALTIVPRHVLGGRGRPAPSEKINVACIGVGDQGTRDMKSFLAKPDVRIVAVCDVDTNNRNRARDIVNEKYGNQDCAAYNNFQEMLEKRKDIVAVLVVTPDHTHAVVSITAMKMGKHVYCQKPLTHTVFEAHKMAEIAGKYKVATQLGTANQATEDSRLLREWIWDGAIGPVREVHNWSNRPIWPQGIDRPKETPPVPFTLDWDLWLGPAPHRPYHPAYLPLVWRGWWDFGTGALGDMGCYSFDTIFRVLKLGHPTSVEGSGSAYAPRMWDQLQVNSETYPRASVIRWQFPARPNMPLVTVIWYDGGMLPPKPDEMHDQDLSREGLLFVGDKGKILCGFSGSNPGLIPESKMKAYKPPPKTLPRSIGHHNEWLRACKDGEPAGANFEFSGLVTKALLLGNVALRTRKKLFWDGPNMKVTNMPEANQYIHCPYRQGWTL
ncbi:MAG: Gfo/Idh/MocA family protein [Planctomycetota bacterium]